MLEGVLYAHHDMYLKKNMLKKIIFEIAKERLSFLC